MIKFSKRIEIIGVNPYVTPPQAALEKLFRQAGKQTSPIPIRGSINGSNFRQTLVRYQGAWRLYVNGPMLKATGLVVGERAEFEIVYDNYSRAEPMNPRLARAFRTSPAAEAAFNELSPGRQKEVLRYLNHLKSHQSLEQNVARVIAHLTGQDTDKLHALMHRKKNQPKP